MSESIKIAFTSCTRVDVFPVQKQWEKIAIEYPDYLFLLGDNIYMDYGVSPFSKEPNGSPKTYSDEKFEAVMKAKYERQWNEPHFKKLWDLMHLKSDRLFGVWDDHDFAWNNACGMHSDDSKRVPDTKKYISRSLFNKYMYGKDDSQDELYRCIDLPGGRVVFLDNRSYAQEPGKDKTLLGKEQFEFLKASLAEKFDGYTLICAALSLTQGEENWSRYEDEYSAFVELVKDMKNVFYIAGDIHKNKLLKPRLKKSFFNRKVRPCHEIIASGMAVNYAGLPFSFDDRHNWGMVEFNDKGLIVTLVDKNGRQIRKIEKQ